MAKTQAPDRDAFRAWLAEAEPDQLVGYAVWAAECPLACFLRSRGARAPQVGTTGYYRDRFHPNARYHPLPDWARRFIQRTDDAGEQFLPVLAGEALATLDGMP